MRRYNQSKLTYILAGCCFLKFHLEQNVGIGRLLNPCLFMSTRLAAFAQSEIIPAQP